MGLQDELRDAKQSAKTHEAICQNLIEENKKYRAALETADRRLRDIAARNGGPTWLEAKQTLKSDLDLIHDGIHEALKEN